MSRQMLNFKRISDLFLESFGGETLARNLVITKVYSQNWNLLTNSSLQRYTFSLSDNSQLLELGPEFKLTKN